MNVKKHNKLCQDCTYWHKKKCKKDIVLSLEITACEERKTSQRAFVPVGGCTIYSSCIKNKKICCSECKDECVARCLNIPEKCRLRK